MPRYTEYARPSMGEPVTVKIVKNRLKQIAPDIESHLRDVRINGHTHGCSGFLRDPATGRIVYINTDLNHGTATHAYYRTAEHLRDFHGGRNQRCDFDEITERALELLRA